VDRRLFRHVELRHIAQRRRKIRIANGDQAGSGGAGGGITDIFSGLSSVKSFSDIGSLLSSSSLASSPVAAAGLSYMLASAIPADLFNLGGKAKGNEVGGEIGNFFGIGGKVLGSAFGSFIGPGRAHPASTFGGNFGSGGFSNVGVEYKHIGAEIGQGAAEALANVLAGLQGLGVAGISGASLHGGVDDGRGYWL